MPGRARQNPACSLSFAAAGEACPNGAVDMKLETVRRYALSLDAVTEQPHHEYSSFRVRGKIFVTVPPSEDAIHVFVEEDDRERALASYPAWAGKLSWGGKVRGLRIALASAAPPVVKALVLRAYEAKAGTR
jgi:hypothetical protein